MSNKSTTDSSQSCCDDGDGVCNLNKETLLNVKSPNPFNFNKIRNVIEEFTLESSNFQKVGEFHDTFEHPKLSVPDLTVFDTNPKLVDLRLKLIEEEVSELSAAINDKNMVEVADALSDILYVVYGAGHAFGIDLDNTFRLVHDSNMTKACSTEEEAKETVEHIKNTETRYNPDYKKAKTGDKWIVFDKNTGKILKNKNYKAVDLSYIKSV